MVGRAQYKPPPASECASQAGLGLLAQDGGGAGAEAHSPASSSSPKASQGKAEMPGSWSRWRRTGSKILIELP